MDKDIRKQKKKIYKEFIENKDASRIYFKMHKVFTISLIGFIFGIIVSIYDISKEAGLITYLMDTFLIIFCLIFLIRMQILKRKEVNKFANKKNAK